MDQFYRTQKVRLCEETIHDFILEGYVPSNFDPNTVGTLDTPNKGSYRWIFCFDGKRIGVEESEITPSLKTVNV